MKLKTLRKSIKNSRKYMKSNLYQIKTMDGTEKNYF